MTKLEVTPVRTGKDLNAFIQLPWRIYRDDPNWTPPLKKAQRKLLTPGRHPFWEFSQRELFVARRGSLVLGRIAAIVDGNHNEYHGEKAGVWGFFESENDPEVATSLFLAAEKWCRDKGMAFMRGPLNPSTNYEIGLLVQGFGSPPALMMTYNQPYYLDLVTRCAYKKEKDLLSFRVYKDYRFPEWALPLAERFEQKNEVAIRHMEKAALEQEVLLANRIYNECWADNWGFVPLTREETFLTVKEMSRIFDPSLAFFLYRGDEVIGVCTCLPDVNPLLKRLNGRMGLGALYRKYRYGSEIRGLRGIVLGIKKEYRQMGAPLSVLHHLMKTLSDGNKYDYLEMGWTLEDNEGINRIMAEGGIAPAKRYRIFRKEL